MIDVHLTFSDQALAELDRAKTIFFSKPSRLTKMIMTNSHFLSHTGNISHEFRTPLTLMLGPLEVRSLMISTREMKMKLKLWPAECRTCWPGVTWRRIA